MRDIAAIRPGAELFFITGADALQAILSWKDADELFRMCHLVGVTRPGYHLSGDHLPSDIVTLLDVPAMAISSSAVRERVRAGRPVWYLVPDGVVQYIGKHSCTGTDRPCRSVGPARRADRRSISSL